MLAAVIAEGVAVALLAVLVLGLLRSHALILRALHELGAGLELEREAAAGHPGDARGAVPVELQTGVSRPGRRPPGSPAPAIVGSTLDGDHAAVTETGLLAFLSSGCSVCAGFWEQFRHGVDVPGEGRLTVIVKDDAEESPATLRRLAGTELAVIRSSAAWLDYDVPGSPYFVFVQDGVVVGEGSASSWPQVRDLMLQ